ncbi:hypothetical protein [Galbibacter sp.]|uniref:hypothetical protein n=1 Tax=Galbibacter sp. TaxID=2918471 RepID=UPI003A8DCF38
MILFFAESLIYGYQLLKSIEQRGVFAIIFWLSFFLFSFVHIFLVLADGWSRYQNYKRVKDQFFIYGFQPRIAENCIGSKCQRSAANVAAEELGIEDELQNYYYKRGVKWFHYIPYFMLRDPFFLFKNSFWSKTFLEKAYTSKFDYHRLQYESSI